ncbi:Nif3-like dinuclear metal center hexameric protein [Alloscardovia theropitheci]|uniref:GTP cyclohydrolase 1 type 2 homolog n=1 Tax=Alloscardovia theropitheci TaxID=2496842 RepID=A0A4R0QQJ2_9BIFI|nr:Nif3-like dinuclear metal center hexameric protein [Alloscardovia theropitheci]TCD54592.1 Nif3-like dinuclear metal center hexameric protein [Alloscardovia theropitheci]
MSVTLEQVVKVLENLYPLEYAESWDEPGLIVGDPHWPVRKIYCAVDPTDDTVQAAIDSGAQLLITHHPLYFRATHTIAGTTFRGALVTKLIEHKCALWVGHTNVDSAKRGQGVAFIEALGLSDLGPLVPIKIAEDKKTFSQGTTNELGIGLGVGLGVGIGRIGELAIATPLHEFAKRVAAALPATKSGILVSGNPSRLIRRVAVLPGSGDSEINAAASCGADVYVTSDLRHHPVLDARQETGMAFINTPHAAIEKLAFNLMKIDVPQALCEEYGEEGRSVELEITDINTDPWNERV